MNTLQEVVENFHNWVHDEFEGDAKKMQKDAAAELAALRSRLAEAEEVMEQAIKAICEGDGHMFETETSAMDMYEAYKSKHATT